MNTACLILAAGQGKRMRSRLPKVLHPVCGEPMIYYPVSLALRLKMSPVIVVTARHAEPLRAYLAGKFGDRVGFATQDPPAGTGHAVLASAAAFAGFRGKLAIFYGDVPLLSAQDWAALRGAGRRSAVAFLSCRLDDPTGYGRVLRGERGEVLRIVEHKDASAAERRVREINTGTYLVDAPFVFEALRSVKSQNAQHEYYLTDLLALARQKGLPVLGVERPGSLGLLGVNDRRELARVEARMRDRLIAHHQARGVTVVDPAHTHLGPEVRLGPDTLLHPGCVLHGKVRIGRGCEIGPGAVIRDATIGALAQVLAYSVLEQCQVGTGARVGPFARLRPGAQLAPEVHVGNFVEVKKTRLGRGSKANHLSYLGDASIGAGVNVGAGTITCNYDGVNKHRTQIDDGVFVGSDTQFVAPVKVGKNAVIGAGTTVTQDVPPGALAISRVRQQNIRGYKRSTKRA